MPLYPHVVQKNKAMAQFKIPLTLPLKIRSMKHLYLTLLFLGLFQTAFSQNMDINLLRDINVNRNTKLDRPMLGITHSAAPISIAAPILVFSLGLLTKNMDLRKKGFFLGEVLVVSTAFTLGMKYGIKRERPYNTHSDIEKLTSGGGPSFPSGHTSIAFATATSLSIAFPHWYVAAPAFLWAGAIGYSRMHLGVHYPSDVLVGALIGSGAAVLSFYMNRWMNSRLQQPFFFPMH
jgi:membrane-associated phospholipid phosphatase